MKLHPDYPNIDKSTRWNNLERRVDYASFKET
jgi:hypothetical protein